MSAPATATTATTTPKIPRGERHLLENEKVLGPLLLAPAIIYIIALVGFPLILAVLYAFSSATAGDPRIDSLDDFVGLKNFRQVLNDGVFTKALRNTVVFTLVSQAIVIVLSNILAQIMVADFPGKKVFRFLVMLPWTTPIALSVLGWFWIFDSVYSPIDWIMRQLDLLGPGTAFGPAKNMYWLGETELARGAVIMIHVWRTLPLATIILLGGLTSIPQDINEAADIDGAGFWRKLFYIRLPLLLPILAIAMLFSMIFTFTDLSVSLVLTRGGPVNDTQVLSSWAYFKGIQGGNLAQGAAVALFMLPVLIAIAIAMLRLARRGAND
jgi:multiple sugar transport system permease protein